MKAKVVHLKFIKNTIKYACVDWKILKKKKIDTISKIGLKYLFNNKNLYELK